MGSILASKCSEESVVQIGRFLQIGRLAKEKKGLFQARSASLRWRRSKSYTDDLIFFWEVERVHVRGT